jgi:hypothetical protein
MTEENYIKRFGRAEADAMTGWKWRRKLLERLISAMEMALFEAGGLESRDSGSLPLANAVPTDRDLL